MTSPSTRRREVQKYLIGFIYALVLTCLAFGLIYFRAITGQGGFYVILLLGLIQVVVHFRYFLHIDLKRNARPDLLLLLFSCLIITLMVGGTLVVLFNLQHRMM